MIRIYIVCCTVMLSLIWHSPLCAARLYLSVSASMTDAFKEIIVIFTEEHPDIRLLPNFASSGSLAKQISQGAPADLYVSANARWMTYLVDNDVIDDSSVRVFAYNSLVFVGSPELQISGLTQITSLEKIGIGTPQSVPAGQYARQAMENGGIYQSLADDRKLVFAKDVRQALLYADRGEVDGSFVYRTDAMLARNAVVRFTVPEELYDRVTYPMALTKSGSGKQEAAAFYAFMQTDRVRSILKAYGFEPAP